MRSVTTGLLLGMALMVGLPAQSPDEDLVNELHAIDIELRRLQEVGADIPTDQFTPEAIRGRWESLLDARRRLRQLDPGNQPVATKIDYLLVLARSNEVLFEFQTLRPWSRDPMFYLEAIRRLAYNDPAEIGQTGDLLGQLKKVGGWLALARTSLVEASGALADIALFHLHSYDGVGQGEPLRLPPPAGIIGWYQLLAKRSQAAGAELAQASQSALREVESFGDWLQERRRFMNTPAHFGWDRYQWYLRNVRLMPFYVSQVETLGRRELSRARTLLAIERRRNRGKPELPLAASGPEYEERVRAAEKDIRTLIEKLQLLSIPEGLPEFETDAFWREGLPRHFWEEIQYRDAHNNHIHASIPGHRFDRLLSRKVENPIRKAFRDGGRVEGWAYYVEGLLLQAGLLDDRPRARELFYIAELARAARIPIELAMQEGDLNLEEAVAEMVRLVPLMEKNLARYDLEIYLRRPAYGMNYVMGRIQLEELLANRSQALGDKFDLGSFHDRFLSFGWIPITLISWEMNGMSSDDETFFQERLQQLRTARF